MNKTYYIYKKKEVPNNGIFVEPEEESLSDLLLLGKLYSYRAFLQPEEKWQSHGTIRLHFNSNFDKIPLRKDSSLLFS